MSPTHVISSISAARTLHPDQKIEIHLLVHWPGASYKKNLALAQIINKLTKKIKEVTKIIPIYSDEVNTIKRRLQIDKIVYNEIYYPHDVVGNICSNLKIIFPNATTICFGDALGNVYEKDVHLSFLSRDKTYVKIIKKIYRLLKNTGSNFPDICALILPVDQSGIFLRKAKLVVCTKSTVFKVIKQCLSSINELIIYEDTLLRKYAGNHKYILLTENISEGNFISLENEIKMYVSFIKNYSRHKDDVFFIKAHPGETINRGVLIKNLVIGSPKIVLIPNRFRNYPIELWTEMVKSSQVLSLSYPNLSLKYLYNINVINLLSKQTIEKWFPKWVWKSYFNSLDLYSKPLSLIESWNGSSVLYSGKTRWL